MTNKLARVTHNDIKKALDRLNTRLGQYKPDIGFYYYADIKGLGAGYSPYVYRIVNDNGGVSYSTLNGKTLRETLKNIDESAWQAPKILFDDYSVQCYLWLSSKRKELYYDKH